MKTGIKFFTISLILFISTSINNSIFAQAYYGFITAENNQNMGGSIKFLYKQSSRYD